MPCGTVGRFIIFDIGGVFICKSSDEGGATVSKSLVQADEWLDMKQTLLSVSAHGRHARIRFRVIAMLELILFSKAVRVAILLVRYSNRVINASPILFCHEELHKDPSIVTYHSPT